MAFLGIKNRWIQGLSLSLFALGLSLTSHAQNGSQEREKLISLANKQLQLIRELSQFAEKIEQGRLSKMYADIEQFKIEVENSPTITHATVSQKAQKAYFNFEYAGQLWSNLPRTMESKIKELIDSAQFLNRSFGLDSSIPTHLLNLFTKIRSAITNGTQGGLISMKIPDSLRTSLLETLPLINRVIVIGTLGDVAALDDAKIALKKIESLYPELNQISIGSEAYLISIEIMGLAEIFKSYSDGASK